MKQYNKKPDNKKKSSISVVNLSTYTSPVVKEVKNLDWIGYGEDNDYYQYLQDRINGSPTNNAIVNGISQMIYGQGLDSTEKNIKPEDYAQAMLLFDDDTLERLCYDLKGMGQCAIQVVYSLDKTRIVECNHFPIETLRAVNVMKMGIFVPIIIQMIGVRFLIKINLFQFQLSDSETKQKKKYYSLNLTELVTTTILQ